MKTLLCLLLWAQNAAAAILTWDRNTDNTTGYNVYWGEVSGLYTHHEDVGDSIVWLARGFTPGVTYYFAVTAYNDVGLESVPSDEVVWTADGGSTWRLQQRRPWLDPVTGARIPDADE